MGSPMDSDGDGLVDSIEWEPTAAGLYPVTIRAVDEFGAFDPANDQLIEIRVLANSANRPPRFTTDPDTDAKVGQPYEYDSNAFDPDGDTLRYTGLLGVRPVEYTISLASLSGQTLSHLTFVNDNDSSIGVSSFSNIRLHESNWLADPQVIKFDPTRFSSYAGQDAGGSVSVLGDNSLLRLSGSAWKQYQLDMPYVATASTLLTFTFAGDVPGELHGIGVKSAATNGKWFQLYGSGIGTVESSAADLNHNGQYDPNWSDNGGFAVHPDTGVVTWNPPEDALGKWVFVNLQVSDQQMPALTDTQPYYIQVDGDASSLPKIGDVDLTPSNVDVTGLTVDQQQLWLQGVISADITNAGTGTVNGPYQVLFFEDVNLDHQYTTGVDLLLGTSTVTESLAPGQTTTAAAIISGRVQYAGTIIWAYVDSEHVVSETDETNNYAQPRRVHRRSGTGAI